MLLKRIELENLKVTGKRSYGLEPLTLITGANSSGKTAILDGCILALTGEHPVGKTVKKLRQLCAGETMEVTIDVVDSETSSPLRYSLQGNKINRSSAGHWTMLVRAEQYAEAGSTARYNLLGSAYQLDELLEAVAKAKDAITGATREQRRIEATVKTEGLELAKLERSADQDAAAALSSVVSRNRIKTARGILASSSEAALKSTEPVMELSEEFEGKKSQDLQTEWTKADEEINHLETANNKIAATAEYAERILESAAECEKTYSSLCAIRQEWKESKENEYLATAKALDSTEALQNLVDTALGPATSDLSRCPLCGTNEKGFYERLCIRVEILRNDYQAYQKKLMALAPPVSEDEIDTARQDREILKNRLAELEDQAVARESGQKEIKVAHKRRATLHRALETLIIREAWAKVKEARETIDDANESLSKNGAGESRNAARVGLKVNVVKAQGRLRSIEEELGDCQDALINARAAYQAAASTALGDLLATAKGLLFGIVSGTVRNIGSEVVIERDAVEITWAAMSGSERLAIGCALKMACSTLDGLLLVDELGVLTAQARDQFLENIRGELQAGRIAQALVVVPGEMEVPGWHSITVEAGEVS